MGKHDGHKIVYVLDHCIAQAPVTITADGNVAHPEDAQYEVIEYDGDGAVWCDTCNEQIYGGEHGLSKYWEVV